jgi:hypothetical protein
MVASHLSTGAQSFLPTYNTKHLDNPDESAAAELLSLMHGGAHAYHVVVDFDVENQSRSKSQQKKPTTSGGHLRRISGAIHADVVDDNNKSLPYPHHGL